MLVALTAAEALPRLDEFSALLDARSESEYALDRMPGALNWPSLHDAERAAIGTEYVQGSPFLAKKRGAALVARNIAEHIEREVLDKPKDWRPLVYCWRGGSRSGALATVLDQIGFRVARLQGGYQAYRRAVVVALEGLPADVDCRVVAGPTGSGKSRLLRALRSLGAQVLDLEGLADHRGSVLGLVPGRPQPTQKQFESRLWDALRRLDPARPVYVESESKRIGALRVPPALVERMRTAPCLHLALDLDARVRLLLDEYDHFVADTRAFCERLDALRAIRGNAAVNAWQETARAGRTSEVVRALLVDHYDPVYARSLARDFDGAAAPRAELAWDGGDASLDAAARAALAAG